MGTNLHRNYIIFWKAACHVVKQGYDPVFHRILDVFEFYLKRWELASLPTKVVVRETCTFVVWYFLSHWCSLLLCLVVCLWTLILKTAISAPIQSSSRLDRFLVSLFCRANLIPNLATSLYAVCSFSLTLEEPVKFVLAPDFVTFSEFLLYNLCHSPKSQRHRLTQPRCQKDSSPAGPCDPNEWAAICTVN